MISSYTIGIYPRSEDLIEATRKNATNLQALFLKEKKEYINLQKKAKLSYVCDPLLEWDDIFRPFSKLSGVKLSALNRIYEMNTFYRRLSFKNKTPEDAGKIVKSNLAVSLLPKNKAACIPEPYTFAERHLGTGFKSDSEFIIFLAKLLRKEVDSLAKAGFKLIQLLGPSIAYNIDKVNLETVKEALSIITKNLKTKTILHFYFGDVSKKIENLLELPVDGFGFDTTTTPVQEIKKHSFSGKNLAVGIVNSYNTKMENKQKCVSEIQNILSKTKPTEAFVTNNFDFEYIPKKFAMKKVLLIGEIARKVRHG